MLVCVVEDEKMFGLVLNGFSSGVVYVFPVPGRCLGVEITTQDEVWCVS